MSKKRKRRTSRAGRGVASYDATLDSLVQEIFVGTPPPIAHHYTTKDGLVGILRSRSIRARHYQDLGDSSELRHVDAHVLAIVDELRSAYRNTPAAEVLAEFRERYDRWKVSAIPEFNLHIACFCVEAEQEHLWRSFGRDGDGFCLGVRTLNKEKNTVVGVEAFSLPVEYSPDGQRERLRNSYLRILGPLARARGASLLEMRKIALNGMARVAAFTNISSKAPSFANEREWRLVVWPRFDHDLEMMESPRRIVWPLRPGRQPLVVASIHVGSRRDPAEVTEIRELLLHLGYGSQDHPDMPAVAMSSIHSTV